MPDVLLDRSLGLLVARGLRDAGWKVTRLAEIYPHDAADVPDETWITDGARSGRLMLTKDKAIRYRAIEREALTQGHLFCLANAQLPVAEMVARFVDAGPAIERAVLKRDRGLWFVYEAGRLELKWP